MFDLIYNTDARENLQQHNKNLMLLATKQVPEFSITDGSIVEVNCWYKTKRNALIRVDMLLESGAVSVTSHFTGNIIVVPAEQVLSFIKTDKPDSEPGTLLMMSDSSDEALASNKYDHLYVKYPHIKEGSIYKVKTSFSKTPEDDLDFVKIEGKLRAKKKKKKKAVVPKGSTRCIIICQTEECNNERDIKVQDAFQVKKCMDCKNKKNKKSLDKFLEDKKPSKNKSKTKKKKK